MPLKSFLWVGIANREEIEVGAYVIPNNVILKDAMNSGNGILFSYLL